MVENEKLITPKDVEKDGYRGLKISQATQVQYRKTGLGYYRVGTKIFYSEKHLTDFLSRCENTAIQQAAAK
jgi:hypothetical protein